MRIVQRLREAAKIVDRLRRFHSRDAGTASKPVRRNYNDSFWPRQCFAQLPPRGYRRYLPARSSGCRGLKQRWHSGTGHGDILKQRNCDASTLRFFASG